MEDRVRTGKAMGLDNLPSASWEVNRGWMLTANIAADLDAWVRLLALHDIKDLADVEPETIRFRLYHLPARHNGEVIANDKLPDDLTPTTPAAATCASNQPGHGHRRSPLAGPDSPDYKPSPDSQTPPPQLRKEENFSSPWASGTRRTSQRHGTVPPANTRNKRDEPPIQSTTNRR
ncbi:MAG: hypothetical protein ACRDSE_15865 [Pseudonocardiaceae bacterium]